MSAYQSPGPLFSHAMKCTQNPLADRDEVGKSLPDICANRHRGNAESKEAFIAIKPGLSLNQSKIFGFIAAQGSLGATTDEVARHFNAMPNEISGRMSELKRDGKIKPDGRRRLTRGGCLAAVCVIV